MAIERPHLCVTSGLPKGCHSEKIPFRDQEAHSEWTQNSVLFHPQNPSGWVAAAIERPVQIKQFCWQTGLSARGDLIDAARGSCALRAVVPRAD
jgi:hypothetical protein